MDRTFNGRCCPSGRLQMVVIELICFVPQTQRVVTHAVDGAGDGEEMLKEFRGDVLIDMIVRRPVRQLCASMLRQYIAIQLVPSAWLMKPPVGSALLRSKHANVVQTEEAALKNVSSLRVLAIDPPGEIQQQLLKHALEKHEVARVFRIRLAALVAIDLKHPKRRPGMHRRIHVAKRPLVGRQLTVRVHVPLARQKDELTTLANSASMTASGRQWKARSQAANQGYSHLSGIEMNLGIV